MKFALNINEGKINKECWSKIVSHLKELADGRYMVSITKYEQERSSQQNRYFHGVVCKQVIEELEQFSTIDHAKHYIKASVGAMEFTGISIDGKDIYDFEQTSKMSKKRFTEFMKDIERWLYGEFNIIMKKPADSGYDEKFFGF